MSSSENPMTPMPVHRMSGNGHAATATPSAVMVPSSALIHVNGGESAPAGPPALTAAPTATTLWRALRRRWPVALAAALAGAILAVVAVMQFIPGQYTAEALIVVNPPNAYQDLGENSMDLKTFRENQQAIIKSSPVLSVALNRPEARALPAVQDQVDAVGWLRGQVKIDFNQGPSILRLSMSGDNPEQLKTLVNAVATAFVSEALQSERSKAKADMEAIKKTLQDIQVGMQKKEQELAKKLVDFNLPAPADVEKKKETLRKGLEDVNNGILKTELDYSMYGANLKILERQKRDLPTQAVPIYLVDDYLKDDEVAKKMKQQIAILNNEIPLLSNKYQQPLANEYAQQYRQQISQLENQLKQYRDTQQDAVRAKLLSKVDADILEMSAKLDGSKDQKARLREAIKEIEADIKKLEMRQTPKEIASLDAAIKSEKVALDKLQDKVAAQQARQSANNIYILQTADMPQTLDRGRQMKLAGGVGLGVFALLLLGVALVEFRTRKINGADEIAAGLHLPLLGTVPALPERLRKPAAQASGGRDLYWHALLTEAIDSVRTMLLHTARSEGLQVVMVGSAVAGEGKTTLAAHLAASLARAWKKTLLIDGDLRNPTAHTLFDQSLEPGFSDVLRGEVGPEAAVHATALSRLWLMPAGSWDQHAVQALAQDGLKATFDRLKEQYDFIVVDSSPLLPVADGLLVGQHVDGVVLSVLRDHSRAGAVHAAQQRLNRLGIPILGAVLLGAEVQAGTYPYSSRSGKR